ncbi:MAG TPA: ImmA/IrrE family metallo-endopeptidase [Gaiellaceae bacterium]|nr:ImmA/IrrE family metallo-endopeptidase [Gaiellaceae bacterium]
MAVCRCRECGARVVTRSRFEVDCSECGAEEGLVAEDAYDPEPEELRCSRCAYVVEGGGIDEEHDDDYAGALTVDDPCPRCGGELVPKTASPGPTTTVSEKPESGVARAVARRLLMQHWTGEMPVDVDRIAKAVGLKVVRGPFRHQGMLRDGVVEVPESEASTAQRFAIAHETGHHELRHQVSSEKIEREANAFASELLLPRQVLKRAVEAGTHLDELRDLFQVSREALHWALQDARLLNKIKS